MRRRINAWRRHWPSRGGHLVKSSTILVGGCIIVISVSLGIVLAFRLGFSAQDASFAAGLAALAMILLQTLAARSRERAEFQRGLDEMRRANAQALHEFDALGGQVRGLDELEARIGDLERRLEHGLAAELEGRIGAEIEAAKASMVSEMQVIEALVRQLAESILPLDAAAGAREPEPEEVPEPQPPASPLAHLSDSDVLEMVRRSIEANRVDVYLQPVVTLPQRKARYYEALTRLRGEGGELILPADYLRVAEPAGIMPTIDNLLLFRSVQIVRRLAQRNREIGIFCNISAHALVDPDFFPQFVEFMEHNKELAKAIIFEFPQSTILGSGPLEAESLAELAEYGFRFSMDHVTSLDMNLGELADQGFRFLKVDARLLIDGGQKAGAQIHPADLAHLLERYGMQLIAEKIETEQAVIELLEFDVPLAQGFLFSEPRPVRGDLLGDGAELGQRRAAAG